MSVVSAVLVWTSLDEPGVRELNEWIVSEGFAPLNEVATHAAGNKHPQVDWHTGGYNHFPDDEFIAFFKTVKWEKPESVMLLINSEHGERPAIVFATGPHMLPDIPELFL